MYGCSEVVLSLKMKVSAIMNSVVLGRAWRISEGCGGLYYMYIYTRRQVDVFRHCTWMDQEPESLTLPVLRPSLNTSIYARSLLAVTSNQLLDQCCVRDRT